MIISRSWILGVSVRFGSALLAVGGFVCLAADEGQAQRGGGSCGSSEFTLAVSSSQGDEIRILGPNPQSIVFGINAPGGLEFGPNGDLYAANFNGGTGGNLLRFDGDTFNYVQTFGGSEALVGPDHVTFGPDGNLYVSLVKANQILRYRRDTGAFIDVFVSDSELSRPRDLAFGPDGHLYVANQDTSSVLKYDGASGVFLERFVDPGSGGLQTPIGIVFGPDGELYVSSHDTDQVLRYDGSNGDFLDVFASTNLDGPFDLRFAPDGTLYVASFFTNEVLTYDGSSGAFLNVALTISTPVGLAFSPLGFATPQASLQLSSTTLDQSNGDPLTVDVLVQSGSSGAVWDVFFWIQKPSGTVIRRIKVTDRTIPAELCVTRTIFSGNAGAGVLDELGVYTFGFRINDAGTGGLVAESVEIVTVAP